jgi:hypothetical protein
MVRAAHPNYAAEYTLGKVVSEKLRADTGVSFGIRRQSLARRYGIRGMGQ